MVDPISDQNRRKYPRLNLPILYRAAPFLSRRHPVMNISLAGVCVYSDEELTIGKRLELEFFMPDNTSMICTARAVWQNPLPEGAAAAYEIGLEFLEISPDDIQRLAKVLHFELPAD